MTAHHAHPHLPDGTRCVISAAAPASSSIPCSPRRRCRCPSPMRSQGRPAAKKARPPNVVPPPELIEPSFRRHHTAAASAKACRRRAARAGTVVLPDSPAPGPALSVHYAATDDTGSLRFPWTAAVRRRYSRRGRHALGGVRGPLQRGSLRGPAPRQGGGGADRAGAAPAGHRAPAEALRGLEPSLHRARTNGCST